jgi:hypothetical protein
LARRRRDSTNRDLPRDQPTAAGHPTRRPDGVICSTNAVESINARIRRAVNARGHFPTDAALKCVYMAIMSLDPTGRGRKRWSNRWKEALTLSTSHLADACPLHESRTDTTIYTVIRKHPYRECTCRRSHKGTSPPDPRTEVEGEAASGGFHCCRDHRRDVGSDAIGYRLGGRTAGFLAQLRRPEQGSAGSHGKQRAAQWCGQLGVAGRAFERARSA